EERLAADDRLTNQLSESLDRSGQSTHATLSGLAERLGRIDAAQTHLATLSEQITGLERTLGDKQARGAYGEIRLSDLLRDALPESAFQEQATLPNGRRADALILLPDPPGPIAIDSKFPLERYLALIDAPDKAAAAQSRKLFARDVAKHVADIADRYILAGETADCAMMFVPSEAVFAEIHASCRDVVEEGFRRRVYIVSPTTLWATLNTARAILKDARVREQSTLLQQETLALVADVTTLAAKSESARRRLALAEADLADLSTAAKGAERRGRRIADLDLDAPDSDSK
ncbi:MAG: DNA recombination protein RmuC, partial [Alphaproteobacteria bacterium]